jgi:hypothetical protein
MQNRSRIASGCQLQLAVARTRRLSVKVFPIVRSWEEQLLEGKTTVCWLNAGIRLLPQAVLQRQAA